MSVRGVSIGIFIVAVIIFIAGLLSYHDKATDDKAEAIAECGVGVLLFAFNLAASILFRAFI